MPDDTATAYDGIRDGPSIVIVPAAVSAPESLAVLQQQSLPPEMQLVVDTARDIYRECLVSVTIVQDEQPRLLVVIKANVPEGAATLRANLGKLAAEVAKGLQPSVLRQSLNFLR